MPGADSIDVGDLMVAADPTRQSPVAEAPAQIEVRGLTMAYGDFVIQRDLDFEIQRGDIFVVMGGSGCGKTTLLRHMVGLKSPVTGDVYYEGCGYWQATQAERDALTRRFEGIFAHVREAGRLLTLTSPYFDHTNPRTILKVADANPEPARSLILDPRFYGRYVPRGAAPQA